MSNEIRVTDTLVVAIFAAEEVLPSVDASVPHKIRVSDGGVVAVLTSVKVFASVDAIVPS